MVFLQGCNFNCIACHNPQTIPRHAPVDGHGPRRCTVDDIVDEIREVAPFIRGITASGGEATQQPAFLRSLFATIKSDRELERLTCLVDSNGACDRATWDELAPVMDGAMIDLKSFDPVTHREMTGRPNDDVLATIEHLGRLGLLHEVRLLMIPGVNDDPGLLTRTARWLAAVDPGMRLKVIGFRAHGSRPHDPPLIEPSPDQLQVAADTFRAVAPFQIEVV